MPGFGKSSRLGKRPMSSSSSSSSLYVSTVTMVMFVAFCLLGVWMLTSVSIVPSQVVTSHRSRSSSSFTPPSPRFLRLKDPPPAFDDNPGHLPDDAIRGDNNNINKVEEKESEGKLDDKPNSTGGETDGKQDSGQEDQNSDSSSSVENDSESQSQSGEEVRENDDKQQQQQNQVAEGETQQEQQVGGNEDNQQQQTQENGGEEGNVENQQLQNDGGNNDNQQQSVSPEEESGMRSQQVQNYGETDENQQQPQEQHMDTQGNENQQQSQEQQMDTENQHQSQEQQMDTENQHQSQEQQMDTNQHQSQDQQMEADGNENRQQSEQLQMENEVDENQQQLQQPQVEAGSNENQQQTEVESGENQQQTETESGQNQQQWHQQQTEVESGESDQQHQTEIESGQKQQLWHQQQTEVESGENEQQPHQQQTEFKNGQNQQQSDQQQADPERDINQQQLQQNVEEGAQTQEQSQQQVETEGSNENLQQGSEQQNIGEGVTITSEKSQQKPAEEKLTEPNMSDSLPDGSQSEVSNERHRGKRPWSTQEDQSENEKERRKESYEGGGSEGKVGAIYGHNWELCNVTAGPDYIPCLDNEKALRLIHNTGHYEHRERHCPEEGPTCLVPLPKGYRRSIEWPKSRDRIWYHNVPRTKLAEVKGHQNWVKVTGQYLAFPGGGTQFIHGALHYIDFIQQTVPDISWGKHARVVLDVGCGVASFGGYLFERDVLAMSFAPKDEHEAQVQFALERGIPAISAVMGSQRLPFPSRVFDLVHCARCRVPWHADGGALLLELNRVLRPGGYFVWSATPVYQKLKEDVQIWKAMTSLTISMCWDLFKIKKDRLNSVGVAIYRKPTSNECYDNRRHRNPPMCKEEEDPNAAWYVHLQSCLHRLPVDASERGSQWPEEWPRRLHLPPYWLNSSQTGIYGKPAPADFTADYEHWKKVVTKSYLTGLGISWSKVRNVMDMRAIYGGFAAALKDMPVWVMNVVNVDSPDTLPIIYERGLFGIYHDWCESFSTYPRTYDLLHADHLFSRLTKRCNIVSVMTEVDRILRPGGKLIVRDDSGIVNKVEILLKSLHWEVRLTFSKGQEGILCAEKSDWRPETYSYSS